MGFFRQKRSRKTRSTQVVPALALPALASTHGQLSLVLIAVVVLILGLVPLLRCRREDIPDTVRALMRMGQSDDGDSGKTPPSLPQP